MSATLFPEDTTAAPTGYWIFGRFFRAIGRATMSLFGQLGERVLFHREIFRALGEPGTYLPLTIAQMRQIGVDSVPLVATVSAFIGAVTAYQTTYQLFPGRAVLGGRWITRQSIVLELGPLLTALVLAGRIGAKMTAEIGTMRVTEQIDALETLAYDPVAYLMVPRVIAGVTMVPLLTIVAIAVGILAGGLRGDRGDERAARRLLRRAAPDVQHLPDLVRAHQGDALRRRDRAHVLVRGIHHGVGRRGRWALDRARRRHLLRGDPAAGCAHGSLSRKRDSMTKQRDEVVVGIFTLIAVVVAIGGTLWLARRGFSKSYPEYTRFAWGQNVKPGQPVNLAGVQVGYVDAVDLDETGYPQRALEHRQAAQDSAGDDGDRHERGLLRRQVDLAHAVHRGAGARVRRHVDADGGAPDDVDVPLQRLPRRRTTRSRRASAAPSMDMLLLRVDSVSSSLSDVAKTVKIEFVQQGGIQDLRKTIASTNALVQQLNTVAAEQSRGLTLTMNAVRARVTAIDSLALDSTVRNMQSTTHNLSTLTASLDSTTKKLDAVMTTLQTGKRHGGEVPERSGRLQQPARAAGPHGFARDGHQGESEAIH